MNKIKGSRHTLLCVEVKSAYKTTDTGKFLHLLKFQDGNEIYVAEEMDGNAISNFKENTHCSFLISYPGLVKPGKPPKLDWVQFEGLVYDGYDDQPQPQIQTPTKPAAPRPVQAADIVLFDTADIAIAAFAGAVRLAEKNEWSDQQILEKALLYAGNIKRIAKRIANDNTI